MMATSAAVSIFWLADSPPSCCWMRSNWDLRKSMVQPSLAVHGPDETRGGHPARVDRLWCRLPDLHGSSHRDVLNLVVRLHQLGTDGEQRLEREVRLLHRGHDAGDVLGLARREVLDRLARVVLQSGDLVDA